MIKVLRRFTACIALAATVQSAQAGVSLYSGTNVAPGKPVQAVFSNQGAWESIWQERLGGMPPVDLEGGVGVLVIPARSSRYFTLEADKKGSQMVMRCVFHGDQRVGGWAAAVINERVSRVSFRDCP